MKKLAFSFLMLLTIIFSMSFISDPITPAELVGTKWISPVNDNCFESLCFTSERTVMYYRCDQNMYAEVGYKVNGDKIEIEAYSNASMDPASKMVLTVDNGILKQPLNPKNSFPKNFIIVPDGVCD